MNDYMIIINNQRTLDSGDTKHAGIYLTSNSLTGNSTSITINNIVYHGWYCAADDTTYYINDENITGNPYTVVNGDIVYYYPYNVYGAAPKYTTSSIITVYEQGNNVVQYTYNEYYVADSSGTALKQNGNKIVYDGSNDVNASWYT